MQRLRNAIVKRMFEKRLTSTQVSFLLYISRVQDIHGDVKGIYYKDACKDLGISYQQFYNLLRDMRDAGFIQYEKASYYDYNIKIIGNDWEGRPHKDYVNTNKAMFYDPFFHKMKGNEKLLAIEFQKFVEINRCSFHQKVEGLYEKYMRIFGVTKRVIRGYLHVLKRFFSIGIKDGQFYISLRKEYKEKGPVESEEGSLNEHEVKVFCRRNRIHPVDGSKDFWDVGRLSVQYRPEAEEKKKNIWRLLQECIKTSVSGLKGESRKLRPKLIHQIIRKKLNLEEMCMG